MTNSLLVSYLWYQNCPDEWKESALTRLKDSLVGVYTSNPSIERGLKYEEKINNKIKTNEGFDASEQFFEQLRGSIIQGWIKPLQIEAGNNIYEFRGKYDFKKDNHIYDLKTTGKPINRDYYTRGFQHIIYMLAEKVSYFTYLVVYLDNRYHIKDAMKIDLSLNEKDDTDRLKNALLDFEKGMKELRLWDTYLLHKCGWANDLNKVENGEGKQDCEDKGCTQKESATFIF